MIRTTEYIYRFRNEPHSIQIEWNDEENENGFEIISVQGSFVALQNFQCAILNSASSRLMLMEWLRLQK